MLWHELMVEDAEGWEDSWNQFYSLFPCVNLGRLGVPPAGNDYSSVGLRLLHGLLQLVDVLNSHSSLGWDTPDERGLFFFRHFNREAEDTLQFLSLQQLVAPKLNENPSLLFL